MEGAGLGVCVGICSASGFATASSGYSQSLNQLFRGLLLLLEFLALPVLGGEL